ncbi:hypothetical protein SAMN05444266_101769 [Chitinophaga jiangningensis]|uniref:Uncharacterized protein n=1 Tax=Chitinophaga jiangningensis TaxID=1419482 RepID=A0A1M6WUR9_9BACT|nr:hypothetical protein SAMN05444266_101769 [Chitinophaga jiangningensis]
MGNGRFTSYIHESGHEHAKELLSPCQNDNPIIMMGDAVDMHRKVRTRLQIFFAQYFKVMELMANQRKAQCQYTGFNFPAYTCA